MDIFMRLNPDKAIDKKEVISKLQANKGINKIDFKIK